MKFHIKVLTLIIVFAMISSPASAIVTSDAMDTYTFLKAEYPEEIENLRLYGANESRIRLFITETEAALKGKSLTEENFNEEVADLFIDYFLDSKHPEIFNYIFSVLDMGVFDLISIYMSSGADKLVELFPDSIKAIFFIIKDNLLYPHILYIPSNQYIYDVNRDSYIDDIDLHLVESYFLDFENFTSQFQSVTLENGKLNTTYLSETAYIFDINKDGLVDDIDVNMMQSYYLDINNARQDLPSFSIVE